MVSLKHQSMLLTSTAEMTSLSKQIMTVRCCTQTRSIMHGGVHTQITLKLVKVVLYLLHNDRPVAYLPAGDTPTIAVRFSPVIYQLHTNTSK